MGAAAATMDMPDSSVYQLDDLKERRQRSQHPYLEFLSVPAMSAGLYVLPAGAADRQTPHGRDEIYYVLEGRAVFVADGKPQDVRPGSVIYVPRGVDHRFEKITKDLSLLVVFAAGEDGGP